MFLLFSLPLLTQNPDAGMEFIFSAMAKPTNLMSIKQYNYVGDLLSAKFGNYFLRYGGFLHFMFDSPQRFC